jgi:hypothetical protein
MALQGSLGNFSGLWDCDNMEPPQTSASAGPPTVSIKPPEAPGVASDTSIPIAPVISDDASKDQFEPLPPANDAIKGKMVIDNKTLYIGLAAAALLVLSQRGGS